MTRISVRASVRRNMKKLLLFVTALALVALFAVSLAACNPTPQGGGDDPNQFENRVYTVTFDTDSTYVLDSRTVKVKYGEKVPKPTAIPVKLGYTFKYWAKSNDVNTEYDFDQPVTSNLTLKAQYNANNYEHTLLLAAGFDYDKETGTLTFNKLKNARKDKDDKILYVAKDGAQKAYTADPEQAKVDKDGDAIGYTGPIDPEDSLNGESDPTGTILLSAGTDGKLFTTYNYLGNVTTATWLNKDENDKDIAKQSKDNPFVFWYYIDDEGKPVQFTSKFEVSDSNKTSVAMLNRYDKLGGLTLIPMFKRDLPMVNVIYRSDPADAEVLYDVDNFTFGDNIPADRKYDFPGTNANIEFDYWYYLAIKKDSDGKILYVKDGSEDETTTNVDEAKKDNGNPVYATEEKEFKFEEEGVTPTSPMDAARVNGDINAAPVDGYFAYGAVLRLYARFRLKRVLSDADAVKNFFAEFNGELDDARWDELCNAHIYFSGDINLDGVELKAPYTEEHPFKGVISGLYGDNQVATITGGTFVANGRYLSAFGVNEGRISDLKFVNPHFSAEGSASDVLYIGAVAALNKGRIEKCSVRFDDGLALNFAGKNVLFGGIAAYNIGSTQKDTGIIRDCTVNGSITATCKDVTFGGIVGENAGPSTIEKCTATVTFATSGLTGKAFAGGIAGVNRGQVKRAVANFTVNSVDPVALYLGGAVGRNFGGVQRTYANVAFGTSGAGLAVGSAVSIDDGYSNVAVGGIVGNNEGYLKDSYCVGYMYITVKAVEGNMQASLGGLIGANYSKLINSSSDLTESSIGAVNYCYSKVDMTVAIEDAAAGVVNVGGLIGRNKYTHLKSNFVLANIAITCAQGAKQVYGGKQSTQEAGAAADEAALTLNYGHLYGRQDPYDENKISGPVGYYGTDNGLTINGAAPTVEKPNGTVSDKLGDSEFVIGDSSTLKFNSKYWKVADGSIVFRENVEGDYDYTAPEPAEPEEGDQGEGGQGGQEGNQDGQGE